MAYDGGTINFKPSCGHFITLKVLSKNSKRPRPVKTNIIPPGAKEGEKTAFFLDIVFTEEECKELIRCSEEKGYEQALVNVGGGRQKLMLSARNNQRCLIDSTELVDAFWETLAEFIPQTFYGYKALGLNERLRFLRYDPGEYFKPHFNGSYERKNGEHSMVTVQIYLNEINLELFQNLLDERLKDTVQTKDDPNLLSETYESITTSVLDEICPVTTRVRTVKSRLPWYDNNIHEERRIRRRLERKWRKSRLDTDYDAFLTQKDNVQLAKK
ncbi:uncharacterized protein LOC119736764 [Patiria miniata]|uniref:Prolyl 4-hydroxylase alpha subunit domain-containing protein n=1 Tax=Patiria miniata TaxID=46514 RepID=A0A914ASR4_PATMI|nr:uncharacterized protein LOC119736764 [Patiria miniata]